jgi:arylsulfatase A-like enzyme
MHLGTASLLGAAAIALGAAQARAAAPKPRPPSFVVIFADDLGYGDLGVFGNPTIRTPALDRMAAEGLRLSSFYSAAEVCTPSRAALLTGRLPVRSGMAGDRRRVLFPDSKGGLPPAEVTIAEALKARGYATACIGKWHLGHGPEHDPLANGFDLHFGLPYSNDMDRVPDAPGGAAGSARPEVRHFNVPLLRNREVVERPAEQTTLTRRYTDEAVAFIERNRGRPFFLYLAHTMPHVPLFASPGFRGRSARGLYGDVVEELDDSVGRVLDALRRGGRARDTLVLFTSDNGPWLTQKQQGGSAGLLREGKGSTWEGGMRVPAIAWWPGRIAAGRSSADIVSALDVLPTLLGLAGAPLPADRALDGLDVTPLLLGRGPSPRKTFFFYRGTRLYAARKGSFKAHFVTQPAYGREGPQTHDPPLLFNLDHDPAERFDVAKEHPEVLADIAAEVERHRAGVKVAVSQVD